MVIAVLDSPEDVRTIGEWSKLLGTSASQTREYCRLAKVSPKGSLDLARLLRALARRQGPSWPIEYMLDVSDSRTLARLLRRANWSDGPQSLEEFIRRQSLITNDVAIAELLHQLRVWMQVSGV